MAVIYLDHAATTIPEEKVVQAMADCMRQVWANPSAAYGAAGEARRVMRLCRRRIAGMLGCDHTEIVFTSGGTESNNLVLRSVAGKHVVMSAIEHSSLLDAAKSWGCDVTLVQPDRHGVIQPDAVEAALRPDTVLIALQWANNETGVIQPVAEAGRMARKRRIPFHVDAVQAFGHVAVDARYCDTMSLSAHKFYGPRGAGALYVRQGRSLQSLCAGGGQEMNLRSGTENVAGICGMELAASLAAEDMQERKTRETMLLEDLTQRLRRRIPGLVRLGEEAARLPGVTALMLPGLSSEIAIAQLDMRGILVSGGAACAASSGKPSHVYQAMGLSEQESRQVIRVSIGRHTTAEEIAFAAETIAQVWEQYRG